MKKENSLLNYLILIIILISLSILLIISILLYGIISSNPKFTTKKLVYNIYQNINDNIDYLDNLGLYHQNIISNNKININNKNYNFNIKNDINNHEVTVKYNNHELPLIEFIILNILKSDSSYVTKTTKDAIINNLNQDYYSVKLEKIELNKSTTYVRKITYEDKDFINDLIKDLTKNEKYVKELKTLTNIPNLNAALTNYHNNNFKLNIYTKGLNGQIVKIELFIDNNTFTYENDLNNYSKFTYNNNSLILNRKDKNHYDYIYNEKYKGTINYNKDANKFNYQFKFISDNKKINASGELKPTK